MERNYNPVLWRLRAFFWQKSNLSSRPWRWDGESRALAPPLPPSHYRHEGKRPGGTQLPARTTTILPPPSPLPPIKRQNAHVYARGWIIDPHIKAGEGGGDSAAVRAPGSPENSSLLASAQPRLRSICSQRCPELRRGACEAPWMFHKAQIYAVLAGNIPIYPLHLPARLWWQRADRWPGLCRCRWHRAPGTFPTTNRTAVATNHSS